MPEFFFAQSLIEQTDLQEGLFLLTKRLEEIVPFLRLTSYVFPRDGSAARCFVVTPGSKPTLAENEVLQAESLVTWLRDHPEPYLVPSHNPVFVPTALKN